MSRQLPVQIGLNRNTYPYRYQTEALSRFIPPKRLNSLVCHGLSTAGATEKAGMENAGLENVGRNLQAWKRQDWKTRDQNAGQGRRLTFRAGYSKIKHNQKLRI